MQAWHFQHSDNAFDYAVLTRALRPDELLLELAASHRPEISRKLQGQPVVRRQNAQAIAAAVPSGKSAISTCSSAAIALLALRLLRELPTNPFSGGKLNVQRQPLPAITNCPDTTQTRRPACARHCQRLRQRLGTMTISNGLLAYLPTHRPEHRLNEALSQQRKACQCALTR
jgi:hypothetical protein